MGIGHFYHDKDSTYDEDMEEFEGEKYSGFGLKRMKSYKCKLKLEQLQKLREKFWTKKLNKNNKNYVNWSIIQKAILLDDPRDIYYLEHFQIEPINGCIRHCKDKEGNTYYIPNYCINDPYFERDLENSKNESIEEKEIKVKIYKNGETKPLFLVVSNKLTGKDLKEQYRLNNLLDNDKKIRIFIYGIEIKDEDYLYQHNLTEDKPIFMFF